MISAENIYIRYDFLPHLGILTTSITTLLLDTETFLISFFVVLTSNVFIEELPVIPVYRSRISNIFYCFQLVGNHQDLFPFIIMLCFCLQQKKKTFPWIMIEHLIFFSKQNKKFILFVCQTCKLTNRGTTANHIYTYMQRHISLVYATLEIQPPCL